MTGNLLADRGTAVELGAHVVACAWARAGVHAAFALGDGTLRVVRVAALDRWGSTAAHDGAVLSLAPYAEGFVSGGDDGKLVRSTPDGETATLAAFGGKWVETLDTALDGKSELIGCGVGKMLHVFAAGKKIAQFEHPSTVTGVAFDRRGKRVAASHYNGASIWYVGSKTGSPRRLEWKGSHIGIALHPAMEAAVTSMQENALHGWRLADGQHMRMSGYPAKSESLSFSRNGNWLASSGAEAVVVWPFAGAGPMGKPPVELGGTPDCLVTRVDFHPKLEMVAAGRSDGSVLLAEIGNRLLPVAPPSGSPVTALSWSPDGGYLAFGTAGGRAAILDCTAR